jgi:hypothetical protein
MIEYLLDKLEQLLDIRREKKKERRLLVDDALRAVSIALNETEIYYAKLERGLPKDQHAEEQLARYWSAASVPLRHVDPSFADRCEHKSRYWVDREQWSDDMDKKYDIRLGTIAKRIRRLRAIDADTPKKRRA